MGFLPREKSGRLPDVRVEIGRSSLTLSRGQPNRKARKMATLLKIIVKNGQNNPNNFFFFQQPSVYIGGPKVYSNSIYARSLPPSNQGSSITMQANLQFYAAVQEANTSTPPIGEVSGFESAVQPIDLAAKGNDPKHLDCATMTWDQDSKSLGLQQPVNTEGVQDGAFRIITATYKPSLTPFNAGSAVMINGNVVLSNFVVASPQTNVDAQPILKYYVQSGTYQAGTVMNFSVSSVKAALCDFTGGYAQALVTYTDKGDWDVAMS